MGKDDKEDSGFGFNDKAKAEETLKLLEKHEPNYRRLTVRGLLGRAKRVLTMTKAKDKIKNIKEAMEVFEKWLAELDAGKEQKAEKRTEKKEDKDSSSDVVMEDKTKKKAPPADKVPGLGFKDKEAAERTLKELKGRDPIYQQLAIKGLLGSASKVLTYTRKERKLANIMEAMGIFQKFLEDFKANHLRKQNNAYLSLGIVRTAEESAGDAVTEQQKAFIAAYASVNGEYKRLRTVVEEDGGKTWDIVRNAALKQLKKKHAKAKLFNKKDEPTAKHLELMLWAYSPEASKVKMVVPETKENKDGDRKRKSSGGDETPSKKKKE